MISPGLRHRFSYPPSDGDGSLVRFRRAPAAPWRRIRAEVLVGSPGSAEVQSLSGSAIDIWDALDVPRTIPGVVARLERTHGLLPTDVREEIASVIDDMVAAAILEEVAEADV